MARIDKPDRKSIKSEDADIIFMLRVPPDIVTRSDAEIENFYQKLLKQPECKEKTTALRRFDFFMQQRQKLLDVGGGKLPFTDDRQ